jgi:hypothetical protein
VEWPEPARISKLWVGYLAGQAAAIVALLFIPRNTLPHALWQTAVGVASAVFALVGVRRFRPRGSLVWYLFSAGLFVNALGLTVEGFHQSDVRPQPADAFWFALYPFVLVGIGTLVYWRSRNEDRGTMVLNTAASVIATLIVAVFAWQLLVWQTPWDRVNLVARVTVIGYPLFDLMVILLVLRLLMTGAGRVPSLALLSAGYCAQLAGDLAWASFTRSADKPTPAQQQLVETVSMVGLALLGAAALHPSVRETAPRPRREDGSRPINWAALAFCVLVPPGVLLVQVLLDLAFYRLLWS